jgi:hypothetical protein
MLLGLLMFDFFMVMLAVTAVAAALIHSRRVRWDGIFCVAQPRYSERSEESPRNA